MQPSLLRTRGKERDRSWSVISRKKKLKKKEEGKEYDE